MANTKAVLIVGGSGFLGTHLALKLREKHKVYATYFSRPFKVPGVTYVPFALGNRSWIKRILYVAKPEVIIYCAGQNNVGWAERFARDAEIVHTSGAANVTSLADFLQPKFIYVSNCYTFDGGRGNYRETDVVLPWTSLGKCKVGGENFIRGKSLNYLIVRMSPIYGRGNGRRMSFLDELRMKLDRGERIKLTDHELHSFLAAPAAVEFLSRLVDAGPKNKILHFGGLTKSTHYEFGQAFARRFGYDPSLISKAEVHPSMMPAPGLHKHRAMQAHHAELDYSLNSSQVAEVLKLQPLLLEEGFDLIEQQLVPRL